MAALHEALKALGPIDYSQAPLDHLGPFLSSSFASAQTIVDSIPITAPSEDSVSDGRSRSSSSASCASEIFPSSRRSAPPPADVVALQKEWKQVKLASNQNPLGMSVYKAAGKDGKGAWFARRSVHQGLGFTKWKRALEREFPESMKVKGGPGQGNIRGIGGERRVAYKKVDGVGKLEVYLLSAQFPGPTTPRDFVTMFLTSERALLDTSGTDQEIPRHFMVISKPCCHEDAQPREGFIRGQYESVEFIREIPLKRGPQKSASALDISSQARSRDRSESQLGREAVLRNASKHAQPRHSLSQENLSISDASLSGQERRSRGKTISFDKSRGYGAKGEDMDVPREDDELEMNPVEWIMITRSDPGGSVPRFMVERGTPGGIVSDASKFLDWACALDLQRLKDEDQDHESDKANEHEHDHERYLHNYQTNGHLAGIEEKETVPENTSVAPSSPYISQTSGGIYNMVTGAAGVAGGFIASHTPAIVSDHFPSFRTEETNGTSTASRRDSVSSTSSVSTAGSFASAQESYDDGCASSVVTADSGKVIRTITSQEKELQKLEEKKRKLDEKVAKAREKEMSKRQGDSAKEQEMLQKVNEKHERELQKLEQKKEKELRKTEEKKRRAIEKDERTKTVREMEEMKAEVALLRKEKEILRGQVGDLQKENTALAVRIGRLGVQGQEVLREVRAEGIGSNGHGNANGSGNGRSRASSLRGILRSDLSKGNGAG